MAISPTTMKVTDDALADELANAGKHLNSIPEGKYHAVWVAEEYKP